MLKAGRSILYPILYFNQQPSFLGASFRFRVKFNGGTEFPNTALLLPCLSSLLLASQGGASVLTDTLS